MMSLIRGCRLSVVVLCMVIFVSGCEAADYSVERKLLINPVNFYNGQSTTALWQQVSLLAKRLGITVVDGKTKPVARWINYYDTADGDLKRHNYILRRRVNLKHGQKAPTGQLMLKYRREGFAMPKPDTVTISPDKDAPLKQELDMVGFADGQSGAEKVYASVSRNVKKITLAEFGTMDTLRDYTAYFPVLGTLGIAPETRLVGVTDGLIEQKICPGYIVLGAEEVSVDISLWSESMLDLPIVAELSWSQPYDDSVAPEQGNKLFRLLQENLREMLLPGQTKEEFVTAKFVTE